MTLIEINLKENSLVNTVSLTTCWNWTVDRYCVSMPYLPVLVGCTCCLCVLPELQVNDKRVTMPAEATGHDLVLGCSVCDARQRLLLQNIQCGDDTRYDRIPSIQTCNKESPREPLCVSHGSSIMVSVSKGIRSRPISIQRDKGCWVMEVLSNRCSDATAVWESKVFVQR